MLKIQSHNISIHRSWSLPDAVALADGFDGCLLYTSPGTSGKILLALNPILKQYDSKGDTLNEIDNLVEKHHHITSPLLFGYVAYDAKHLFETENVYQNLTNNRFPQFEFVLYQYVIIFSTNWTPKQCIEYSVNTPCKKIDIETLEKFRKIEKSNFSVQYGSSSPDKTEFKKGVDTIRNYIGQGDVYQVNLTRKITCSFTGSVVEAATRLLESNRIEFGVFQKSDKRYIISTSPERFLTYSNNNLLTSPIKGTLPKTINGVDSKHLLLNDTKNLRELAMITDLLRNDISVICKPGSVQVRNFPNLKELNNVYHLVSDIEGELRTQKFSDIIRATFPGGSISGCPKIRACQIIEELEKQGRGPYTGSFGYLTGNNTCDLNILIRTVFIEENLLTFHVGGGITFLSDSKEEFEETEHKAQNIFQALNIEESQLY